jgi:tRNA A64-2'-O-ribosylphosphate transferase
LRPLWVTQTSTLPHTAPDFPDFHPVILCTASRRVRGAEASEGGYIQGAADDHEAWSHGLTPALFWANKDALLQTNEEELPAKIGSLVSQDRETDAVTTLVNPTTSLYISASSHVDLTPFDTVVSCTPSPLPQPHLLNAGVRSYLHLACQTGKLGSRSLRAQLPALLTLPPTAAGKTLICCPTGKDVSVGTALAYLCLYAADDGTLDLSTKQRRSIDKVLIKQRLSWITTSNAALNPSRATLQSVNSVLMSSATGKSGMAEVRNPAEFDADWALIPVLTRPLVLGSASDPNHTLPNTPHSLFAAWQDSSWTFTRTLTSALPSHPSGLVTGTARFTPMPLAYTLLYSETGEFVTETGMKFTARRRYVYQLIHPDSSDCDSDSDESKADPFIRVCFFDDEERRDGVGADGQGVGGVFVEMGRLSLEEGEIRALNRAQHLCGEDVYAARWVFCGDLSGGEGWWEVRYDVKGPKKEYVSSTRYTRAGLEE